VNDLGCIKLADLKQAIFINYINRYIEYCIKTHYYGIDHFVLYRALVASVNVNRLFDTSD